MTLPPIIATTVGDPAGIGPEVAVAAALLPEVRAVCRPMLVGDRAALGPTLATMPDAPPVFFARTAEEAVAALAEQALVAWAPGRLAEPVPFGAPTREGGAAGHGYVMDALAGWRAGWWRAVCTAPISKEGWALAGFRDPGHTELFAREAGARRHAMMLTGERITVALATIHQPLATVPASLTVEGILDVVELLREALLALRGREPKLALLGLNPHAGEAGLLGREEIETIIPAAEAARARGYDVEGPLPPDTAFTQRALLRYDGHVCMYHDQGLIPFKLLAFEDGVNTTLGLPGLVRTSPDHGTAYGLAGKRSAEASSMAAALKLAARLTACPEAA
ncbi:MAG: 4-hydroxythreonine-4-phosphate dehydrogenase PdxA [Candidatus Sumerlaeia bacterium]|nr:4-hydroxythreonine-4-phosphate dehydrogenase PdxA [Candidatus Sumerlaeia bacterium]